MTDYKVTLKSNIQSVEVDKKKVKITCHNAKAGNLVITTLSQNSSLFNGKAFDISKGLDGAKDFNIKFKEKDHAQAFADNITAILNDTSVAVEEAEKSGWQNFSAKVSEGAKKIGETVKQAVTQQPVAEETAPAGVASSTTAGAAGVPVGSDGASNKKVIIIAGAVAIALVLILVIWKSKK